MQQRQLRLGDVLDDYCPRERRITNHAVVAMVGQEIKLTRCTTCEAEHEFKHAKVPATRRKKAATLPASLSPPAPPANVNHVVRLAEPAEEPARVTEESREQQVSPAEAGAITSEVTPAPAAPAPQAVTDRPAGVTDDEGRVHRRLIRATLPRPEGPLARPAPQFTIRDRGPGGRPFHHKPASRQSHGNRAPAGTAGVRGGARKGAFGSPPRHGHAAHAPHGRHPGKKRR